MHNPSTTDVFSGIPADTLRAIAETQGTPCYVYHRPTLEAQAEKALAFPHTFGLTVRYAMKALPNAAILRIFHNKGLHIDASSGPEVHRALAAGLPPAHICLSSQELPEDFAALHRLGVEINACSLQQLERFGQAFPGGRIGLRFNPGAGSGGNNRTNVGGPSSSFGIWHELIPEVRTLLAHCRLTAIRIHTHIGSGSDPAVWQNVASMTLDLARAFPDVATVNLGGGYKVGRVPGEKSTQLDVVGAPVRDLFSAFAAETGRRLHLEIEPGTFLVANAGAVLARVQDTATTGAAGYDFLKLDTGMTEVLRPSLYGAQHPIRIVPASAEGSEPGESRPAAQSSPRPAIVVGHCCESGDILTPTPGDPELLAPRDLPAARIGDLCIIGGAGAYCAGMATKNYNSFPEAPEVLLDADGGHQLIRRRQSVESIWANEVAADL